MYDCSRQKFPGELLSINGLNMYFIYMSEWFDTKVCHENDLRTTHISNSKQLLFF